MVLAWLAFRQSGEKRLHHSVLTFHVQKQCQKSFNEFSLPLLNRWPSLPALQYSGFVHYTLFWPFAFSRIPSYLSFLWLGTCPAWSCFRWLHVNGCSALHCAMYIVHCCSWHYHTSSLTWLSFCVSCVYCFYGTGNCFLYILVVRFDRTFYWHVTTSWPWQAQPFVWLMA